MTTDAAFARGYVDILQIACEYYFLHDLIIMIGASIAICGLSLVRVKREQGGIADLRRLPSPTRRCGSAP